MGGWYSYGGGKRRVDAGLQSVSAARAARVIPINVPLAFPLHLHA